MYSVSRLARRVLVGFVLVMAVSACSAAPQAKNVILIIGDGMGIGSITAARCATVGANGNLVLDSMPVTGLAKTHSENSLVTDSAASGTALATGHKTNNGCISVDSKGASLSTILELADSMGKSTGVITTDLVTSATPAVFYAHVPGREQEDAIALQLISSKVDVAMGGGESHFIPIAQNHPGRQDGKDLVPEAKSKGFDVVFDEKSMAASTSKRLLGLFSFENSSPSLQEMLEKSVSILSANHQGFFLMAESCYPDKGGHANDYAINLKGVIDLENALRAAMKFAKADKNTLVVVTADHETGGLAVLNADGEGVALKPTWLVKNHTGNMVSIYAFGPGSEAFSGTHDNTEIPKTFARLWKKTLR